MDYSAAKFWFDVMQTVLIALVGIQSHLSRKQAATIGSINRIEDHIKEKLDGQNTRLTRVEEAALHNPKHDDLGKIYDKLNEVNGELKELKGEVRHLTRSSSLLYENELGKKS